MGVNEACGPIQVSVWLSPHLLSLDPLSPTPSTHTGPSGRKCPTALGRPAPRAGRAHRALVPLPAGAWLARLEMRRRPFVGSHPGTPTLVPLSAAAAAVVWWHAMTGAFGRWFNGASEIASHLITPHRMASRSHRVAPGSHRGQEEGGFPGRYLPSGVLRRRRLRRQKVALGAQFHCGWGVGEDL